MLICCSCHHCCVPLNVAAGILCARPCKMLLPCCSLLCCGVLLLLLCRPLLPFYFCCCCCCCRPVGTTTLLRSTTSSTWRGVGALGRHSRLRRAAMTRFAATADGACSLVSVWFLCVWHTSECVGQRGSLLASTALKVWGSSLQPSIEGPGVLMVYSTKRGLKL